MAQHRHTRLIAGTCLTGIATLVLAACSSGGSSTPTTATGGAVSSITASQVTTGTAAKDVDAVTWSGDYRPLISLDPIKIPDYPEETAIPNLCEPLLRVAPDYSTSPGLAASHTFTDPTTLVIKLRQGVTFSDGSPMTADDVVFSLRRTPPTSPP